MSRLKNDVITENIFIFKQVMTKKQQKWKAYNLRRTEQH